MTRVVGRGRNKDSWEGLFAEMSGEEVGPVKMGSYAEMRGGQ